MVLFLLNGYVSDTYAQNPAASGGPGGNATATATKSGSETYPCYGTCNYYNGPSATASGGAGGKATSNHPPPLIPQQPKQQAMAANNMTSAYTPPTTSQSQLTYQNPTYGVTMQYPTDWIKNDVLVSSNGNVRLVIFSSPSVELGHHVAQVELGIRYTTDLSLNKHLLNTISGHSRSGDYPNFHLGNSDTSSKLGGQQAYKFTFDYTRNSTGFPMAGLYTGTIVNSKVYWVQVTIDADQSSNYMPITQKMIDSVRL